MVDELQQTIFTALNSITSLSGKVFYLQAPVGTEFPYLVFQDITNTPDRDTENFFENSRVQVNIYTKQPAELSTLTSAIKNKLDDKERSLTIANYLLDSVDRVSDRTVKFDDVIVRNIEYKFLLTKL